MARLKKMGAHKIIGSYFFGLMMWFFVVSRTPWEWMGFWVFVLMLASVALLLLVLFADVGSTWSDKE